MAVQLIIDGNHIHDILAQVHTLAAATGAEPKNVAGETITQTASTQSAASTTAVTSTAQQSVGGKTDTKAKTLTREEQDEAVEGMVAVGKKDDRFEQLTKGRQKTVEDGIAAKSKAADEPAGDDLEDMFADDDAEEEVEVTADTVREMMGKLGKDADGNPVQDNLIQIKNILTKFIPKGEEIKVGKIPADKLKAVFAELKALEA